MTIATKSRGIFMSAESVDAIWADRKTQTRRVVKPQPKWIGQGARMQAAGINALLHYPDGKLCSTADCPYGVPGDLLWVRRTRDGKFIWRKAEADLSLRVVEVAVQQVQKISIEDCFAEGLPFPGSRILCAGCEPQTSDIRIFYRMLWDSLNAKRGFSWESNPWVWVVKFERVTSAISDQQKETT